MAFLATANIRRREHEEHQGTHKHKSQKVLPVISCSPECNSGTTDAHVDVDELERFERHRLDSPSVLTCRDLRFDTFAPRSESKHDQY
jgi:hypothetical protein